MATTIPDDQLPGLLKVLEGADSVELKLTVPDRQARSIADALGMDILEAQIRQVVFFDTPDLALSRAGVVVRARRIQGGAADTVIKLRPVDPADLPQDLRNSASVVIEVDAIPGGYVCSAGMKGKSKAPDVRRVILGQDPIKGLFSKEQKAFYKAHAPAGLKLSSLSILGPINVLKLKFTPEGFDRPMVAELWFYPDGTRILELSTKGEPREAFQVAASARAYLKARGVDLDADQQTKTRSALEYFAGLQRRLVNA